MWEAIGEEGARSKAETDIAMSRGDDFFLKFSQRRWFSCYRDVFINITVEGL